MISKRPNTSEKYSGTGIPYLVVIDAATRATETSSFSIVYQHAGFEGVQPLRQVIDSVGALEEARFEITKKPGAPRMHTVEADTEALRSSDSFLTQSTIGYRQTQGKTERNSSVSHASIDMDFSSSDIFTMPANVREDRFAAQFSLRHQLSESPSLLASAGLYDGRSRVRAANGLLCAVQWRLWNVWMRLCFQCAFSRQTTG